MKVMPLLRTWAGQFAPLHWTRICFIHLHEFTKNLCLPPSPSLTLFVSLSLSFFLFLSLSLTPPPSMYIQYTPLIHFKRLIVIKQHRIAHYIVTTTSVYTSRTTLTLSPSYCYHSSYCIVSTSHQNVVLPLTLASMAYLSSLFVTLSLPINLSFFLSLPPSP